MIIQYPNLMFRWHNPKQGICGTEDYITDFAKGKYGYELTEGQKIYMIVYEGERYIQLCYHSTIQSVNELGVTLADWMEKGWETDRIAKEGLCNEEIAFLPWKRDGADLLIEPCESFFENYSAKDLINGTAPRSHDKLFNGKVIKDPNGEGLFYKHGGWRSSGRYEENIKHIIKLQMELEL